MLDRSNWFVLGAAAAVVIAVVAFPEVALAADGGDMPWSSAFSKVLRWVRGPFIAIAGTILMIGGFVALAATKGQGNSWQNLFFLTVGISGAAAVATRFLGWMGVTSGALF